MDLLVSTKWLEAELGAPDLRILDVTWFLEPGHDAKGDYQAAHIPGAAFMDLDEFADEATDLPNMLPTAAKFADLMGALGVGDEDRIVVYDNSPHHTAARGWWMLTTFGARNVAILDGGMGKWKAEGRPLESGMPSPVARNFSAHLNAANVRQLGQVRDNLANNGEQMVDARSAKRFAGEGTEPRAGLASGHIPGSRNLPHGHLFNADDTWKTGDALRREFDAIGIDPDQPVMTTCGSGVTACVLSFGLALLGKHAPVYDGSWSEWGADPSTPKATGST